MLSSASEYCIQSLLLPRKTTTPPQPHTQKPPPFPPPSMSPPNVTQKPKKVVSTAGKGKTEFLSLQCGVTEMTLTAQQDK